MTSNKLKLLCAGAGVGAMLTMAGVSVVQGATFSADPAPPGPGPGVTAPETTEPLAPGDNIDVTTAPREADESGT
ncbi:hypothetical protein ASE48_22370 [Mycobacterium sp. Root265]|uniref:hypothetical protein n=1 Tax=Mycobacterium sp. Root265 TaxID=1736504 RepID=UPI00070BC8F8|nr:hypothetical protein [Mycobacterium sp. Root265]KRD19775.1 hypothetical protein ASE48_22370 [Mycobacterium sp. Root265]